MVARRVKDKGQKLPTFIRFIEPTKTYYHVKFHENRTSCFSIGNFTAWRVDLARRSGVAVARNWSRSTKLRRPRLVLRWVNVSGFNSRCRTFISVCNQPPRPVQPSILPGSVNEDQLRLRRKRQVYGSLR